MLNNALLAATQASFVTVAYSYTNPHNLELPDQDHNPMSAEIALRCALHNLQQAQANSELPFYGLAALEYLEPVVDLLNTKGQNHA